MRAWHPTGCAHILISIKQEKFRHLDVNMILSSLASCINSSPKKPFKLTAEAFSDNERNFKSDTISDCLQIRLGIDNVWGRLAREPELSSYISALHPDTTIRIARQRLNGIMQRRNDIIHRGRSYYTPGYTEVTECASFLKALVKSLANVLIKYECSL